MDIEKLTVRVQKSLNEAYNEAVKHHNQTVDVIHLQIELQVSYINASKRGVDQKQTEL